MKSALLVACLGLAISSQLVHSSSYGGSDGSYSASSGYGGDAYGGGAGGAGGGGAERPRVNLGISLKVPAMKINLGRMNMPRISIRAKIKQSHGPKVINVPEMHIDTNSKIPGPEGARPAGHGAGYESSSSYGGNSPSYESSAPAYGGSSSSGYGSSSYGSSSYGSSEPSYESQGSSGYEQAPSHGGESAGGYEVAPAGYAAPAYEPAASTYDDTSAPASYGGNQGYSSSYSDAPSNGYNKPQLAQNTRNQYGSAGNVYAQQMTNSYAAPKPYAPQAALPMQSQSYMPSRGYQAASSNYAQSSSYSAPKYSTSRPSSYSNQGYSAGNQNINFNNLANAQYSAASSSSAYQQAPAYQAPTSGSYLAGSPRSIQNYGRSNGNYGAASSSSYGVAPASAPSYGASGNQIGYQPLEPGHTMLSASNDNYEGTTKLTMASEPPKEYGYQSNSYRAPSSSSYQAPAAYQAPTTSYQQPASPSYFPSQPTYDDSYSQGNYGARVSSPSNQPSYTEAY